MGIAYCAIKYEFAGKPYETAHTIHSGISLVAGQNTFTEDDLNEWGFFELGTGFIDARTDPSNPLTFDPRSLIESIIGLHRAMQGPLVRLKQVYINDGFTLGEPTGNFATFDLDLACKSNGLTENLFTYAPANNALMLDKGSAMFSRRGGRMWLRGAMALGEIMPSAQDGVTLVPGARVQIAERLEDYEGQSPLTQPNNLANYYFNGVAGVGGVTLVQYCVGRTKGVVVAAKERRILDNWTSISGLTVDDAQSRDTRRRNKKAVSP